MNQHSIQTEIIRCEDGYQLGASIHYAATPKAVVVIGSAFGVSHTYYKKFAAHLSENGFHVVSFDYRGTGSSAENDGSIELRLSDWGKQDIQAALSRAFAFGLPCYFIGHSIGGQLLPLAKNSREIRKAVFMAASMPYWGRWAFPAKLTVFINTRLLLPIFARLLRQIPADKFGLGNLNIPSSFVRTWCRWMSTPDYFFHQRFLPTSKEDFQSCKAPKRAYCFTDDALAPLSNVNKLMSYYVDGNSEVVIRSPSDCNVSSIGHSGFIRSVFADSLWQETIEYFSSS